MIATSAGHPLAVVTPARTAWRRMVGLLGRKSLARGHGILLEPAWSIHTWFMRFPIDVVFLDRDHRVLRVCLALPPWRLVSARQARVVLEFGAGTLDAHSIRAGEHLRIAPPR